MKKTTKILLIICTIFLTTSCDELAKIAEQSGKPVGITNAENIAGLKEALNVGIGNAVGILGKENGFFNDAVLKILLPPEAKQIVDNIKLIPGGQDLVNKAILSLNRAAEDAVKSAVPIFKNAITSMTISDATNILFGADDAATQYLRRTTYNQLSSAFAPKVKQSLDKPLVANVSTNESWNALTSAFNTVANSVAGRAAGLKTVSVNLETYVTEKALDALFTKITAEEKAIRTNPAARVNDLLKRVFGQLK
ncbi:MAG: DUF4197 domain-containing protein [Bacteroidales bacterium]|nr:DUF4197 domain-containing protein [Bacteroidales bacterium]